MLEKTLKSPLDERRSSQTILKEVYPEYSLEGLVLKQKLQYFGYPMQRADSLEKTLMLKRGRARGSGVVQRMKWLDSITDSMDTSLIQLREIVKDR